MATQCFVLGYSDEAVDQQVTPHQLHMAARYLVYEDVVGIGRVGKVDVTLNLTDSVSQQVTKIKTAVRDHIQNVEQFPHVPTINSIRIPSIV